MGWSDRPSTEADHPHVIAKDREKKDGGLKRIDGLGGSTISKVSLNYMSKDES